MQCPECQSSHIRKNGKRQGKQNHICVNCGVNLQKIRKCNEDIAMTFDELVSKCLLMGVDSGL